ncbi:hypothetical protein [Roseivirga pacifica]|uniref:hypothetical protein n=1 Tax=Roseivirga pacifica TaxID=1267423 RepID=UPI002094CA72|nr:hypothetical protein [Roseivirga pacifica]MCO6357613.1 hypothetical protein [Roseivirga pacifica]MCO6365866.1 hypothetical protein [Roseivirga pacifica]MCO6371194.1 hypothetical protein [Roseivirga pacifica]MCO6375635.1 hypothetical protein [Roseivirga pacifica]MCO6378572.1 hypothetical protein [Roseivirga pacifica]
MNDSNQIMIQLINAIIREAEHHLNKSSEFYPFAYAYTKGQLVPVNVFSGEELPSVKEHLSLLSTTLSDKYDTYAIGVNSTFRNEETNKPLDVIEIRMVIDGEEYVKCGMPYQLNDKDVVQTFDLIELE